MLFRKVKSDIGMNIPIPLFKFTCFLLIASDCHGLRKHRPMKAPPSIRLFSYMEIDATENIPAESEFHTQDKFQNDFILKNGSDYVVLNGIDTVVFTCWASFPLTWKFQNIKQLDRIPAVAFQMTTKRTSTLKNNQAQPRNVMFETTLRIRCVYCEMFSATLECKAVESLETGNTDKKGTTTMPSSIHLFFEGRMAMEKMGETIKVYVPLTKEEDMMSDEFVVLPCRPWSPNLTVLLEKREEQIDTHGNITKSWNKIQFPSSLVNFDPKSGFSMLKDPINGQRHYIFGLYRCSILDEGYQTDNNDNNINQLIDTPVEDIGDIDMYHVYVNVSALNQSGSFPETNVKFEAITQVNGNASVRYNRFQIGNHVPSDVDIGYRDSTEIMCCSGVADHLPVFYTETCNDPLQCEIAQKVIAKTMNRKIDSIQYTHGSSYYHRMGSDRSDCSRWYNYENKVAFCVGDNVKFAHYFVNLFEEDLMSVANRSERRLRENFMITPIISYETESSVSVAPLARKVILVLGHYITNEELLRNRHQYVVHGGLSLLDSDYSLDGTLSDEYDDVDKNEIDFEQFQYFGLGYRHARGNKIAEYPRDVHYEGEPLVSVCLGFNNMYSDGLHLSILWRNGSRTVLKPFMSLKRTYKTLYFSEKLQVTGSIRDNMLLNQVSPEVTASKDMMALECWIPQWNTTKWDKMTRNLTILDPYPPQFAEGEGNITEEVVYYYLDEEAGSNALECQLVKTAPEPRLNVTKDGIGILGRFQGVYTPNYEILNLELIHFVNVTILAGSYNKGDNSSNSTTTIDDGEITIKIGFSQVTHEIQGVYQCTAENIGGKVTRTFRVVVLTSRKYSVLLLVFFTMLIVLLLVVGIGGICWRQKRCISSFLK